jgi:mono/diheme cytochrome c family protein
MRFTRQRSAQGPLGVFITISVSAFLIWGGYHFSKKLPSFWKTSKSTEESSDGGPGEKLFEAKCAVCHGKDGKGNPKMYNAAFDLTAKPWRNGSDRDAVRDTLLYGIPGKGHPTLKETPEDELDDLIDHVRDFAPEGSEPSAPSLPKLRDAIRIARWEPVDSPAPDLKLRNVRGEVKPLSVGRGKVVLLTYWSSTCPPCKAQITGMESLLSLVPDRDFLLVPLCVDVASPKQAEQELRKYSPNLVAWTPLDPKKDTEGISSVPTTLLIDRDGVVQAKRKGLFEVNDEEFLRLVRVMLARPAGQAE